jgi:hypothetical protein
MITPSILCDRLRVRRRRDGAQGPAGGAGQALRRPKRRQLGATAAGGVRAGGALRGAPLAAGQRAQQAPHLAPPPLPPASPPTPPPRALPPAPFHTRSSTAASRAPRSGSSSPRASSSPWPRARTRRSTRAPWAPRRPGSLCGPWRARWGRTSWRPARAVVCLPEPAVSCVYSRARDGTRSLPLPGRGGAGRPGRGAQGDDGMWKQIQGAGVPKSGGWGSARGAQRAGASGWRGPAMPARTGRRRGGGRAVEQRAGRGGRAEGVLGSRDMPVAAAPARSGVVARSSAEQACSRGRVLWCSAGGAVWCGAALAGRCGVVQRWRGAGRVPCSGLAAAARSGARGSGASAAVRGCSRVMGCPCRAARTAGCGSCGGRVQGRAPKAAAVAGVCAGRRRLRVLAHNCACAVPVKGSWGSCAPETDWASDHGSEWEG